MKLFRAKCNTCNDMSYIFPDQIEKIKLNDNLKLFPFIKDISKGSKWFCIKCDASKKNGNDCFIISELTGDKAKHLLDIRKRETTLKSSGFVLPKLY